MIFDELEGSIKELNLQVFYDEILAPVTTILAKSEFDGCDVDINNLNSLDRELRNKMNELEDNIIISVGKQLNISSGPQLKELFFTDENGLRLFPIETSSKTGEPSLDEGNLSSILAFIDEELNSRNGKKD